MKYFKFLLPMLMIGFSTTSYAVPINMSFTADNVVEFYLLGDVSSGGTALQAYGDSANDLNWKTANSATIDLAPGKYDLIFQVSNIGSAGSGNPAGFLAEINGTSSGDVLTDSSWLAAAATFNPANAVFDVSATEYGNNGGANIWTAVNPGPIAGISTSAQWIWDASNTQSPETIFLKTSFSVPEPSILVLLGGGLIGLSLVRSRRTLKA